MKKAKAKTKAANQETLEFKPVNLLWELVISLKRNSGQSNHFETSLITRNELLKL
jgi:hypothetical protein